ECTAKRCEPAPAKWKWPTGNFFRKKEVSRPLRLAWLASGVVYRQLFSQKRGLQATSPWLASTEPAKSLRISGFSDRREAAVLQMQTTADKMPAKWEDLFAFRVFLTDAKLLSCKCELPLTKCPRNEKTSSHFGFF